jgi:Ni,Fe-hydrogenase I cytochrome b subunit
MYHRALYCEINDILLLVVIHQLIDWHMVVFVVVFAFAVVVEDAVVEDAVVAAYQLFVSLADAFASIVAVVEVAAAV